MARVFIPPQLRNLTGGVGEVEIEAENVGAVVDALERRFPGVRARLCRGEALAPSLQVSVDGVMSQRGLRAAVAPHSEVHFLPAMVGG